MMMNELSKPVQCMKIYSEIKQILIELGLVIEKNDNFDNMYMGNAEGMGRNNAKEEDNQGR